MKFEDAIHSCKCGAYIRDESGTMDAGWKIAFRSFDTVPNPAEREGCFVAISPPLGTLRQFQFSEAQRASDEWRTTL